MPWHTLVDAPITFADQYGYTWTPQNWSKKYTGQKMTLRQALAKSVNSITAYLTKQLGPEVIVSYAQRLGITSPINPTPSLCLGSYDVSVYELAGAYSTFMNKGVWIQPFYITHIEDKNGRIIEEFIPQKREAINENTAYLMIHMLKGSIEEIDSISNVPYAIKCDNELGVKTGTTSNQSDGWFVSLSNGLCTCTWVGADNRCVHFKDLLHGSGAKVAKPLWNRFILKVYNDERLPYKKGPIVNYPKPLGLVIPESKFTTILDCIPDDEQEQEDKTIDLITEDE